MNFILPALVVAAGFVLSRRKGGGGGGPPTDERGFAFTAGCSELVISDVPRALAWARKYTASLPNQAGWEMQLLKDVFGGCSLILLADKTKASALAQKHVLFLWQLILAALRGAVDSGKLTEAEAQGRIDAALSQVAAYGTDPSLLTPKVLPP